MKLRPPSVRKLFGLVLVSALLMGLLRERHLRSRAVAAEHYRQFKARTGNYFWHHRLWQQYRWAADHPWFPLAGEPTPEEVPTEMVDPVD